MAAKILRNLFLTILISLFVFSCDKITEPDPVDDPTDFSNYELVWADEFEQASTTPDPAKWGYDLGYGTDGWGNDEWQFYTDETENVRVEDGNLIITAVFDSVNFAAPGKRDGSVTSARINTKNNFSFKYGKIQARIKAPTDAGMWPAFWMLGVNFDTIGWPYCGEIDIMEISPLLHDDKTTLCTMHWWDDLLDFKRDYGTTYRLNESLDDDYHVYEVEWDEQRVVGKIDGITYFHKIIDPVSMDEFLREFFVILNVAVGGNLGGTPDDSTQWPQQMYVDWIRVYQTEEDLAPVETFGIFTDETPVDDGLEIGVNAEIYVWENTLTSGSIPPYEGPNVISWQTTGLGWFGGGISSNVPVDLSEFEFGNIKFRIKIPENVTFKIGILDFQDNQNYVEFPAGQTTYGLVRDGEWGQAVIPVVDIMGNVNLDLLVYEFIILEENGTQCEFALDDIYWDGGGTIPSSVSFNAEIYDENETNAYVAVIDQEAAGTDVQVDIDNGQDSISLDVTLDEDGNGTGTLNFGPTDDETDTISITGGDIITATYVDANGMTRTDTAEIETETPIEPDNPAPVPNLPAEDVISLFSNPYVDVPVDTWSPEWDQADVEDIQIQGDDTKLYTNLVYAVIEFASQTIDATEMSHFHMDIWTPDPTSLPAVFKIKLVDFGADGVYGGGDDVEHELTFDENSIPSLQTGEWISFDIPLSDFTGLTTTEHLAQIVISGDPNTVYIDNVYFVNQGGSGSDTAGIYSESHTETMIPYIQLINSADWGGNSAVPDLENTDVTPVDGDYVLAIDYQAGGATYCGLTFDFGSVDISGYQTLVLNIDTSAMPDLVYFGIKLEDNSAANNEINISTLTPVINGNWANYEIPLSLYPAVDLSDLKYLGLWNPRDNDENLLVGTLYFDDIYLINR